MAAYTWQVGDTCVVIKCKADHAVETDRQRLKHLPYTRSKPRLAHRDMQRHWHTDILTDTGTQTYSQTLAHKKRYPPSTGACVMCSSHVQVDHDKHNSQLVTTHIKLQEPSVHVDMPLVVSSSCTWSSSVHGGWWAEQRCLGTPPGHLQQCQIPVEKQCVQGCQTALLLLHWEPPQLLHPLQQDVELLINGQAQHYRKRDGRGEGRVV